MSRILVASSLFFAVAFVLPFGCSVDECEKHPERSQCLPGNRGTEGAFTVSPRRLNIKGDTVTVSISAKTRSTDSVTITQSGATELELGMLGSDGMVPVPMSMLNKNGFKPGAASLLIGTNPAEPMRFYLAPDFVRALPDIATGTELPIWVGAAANPTLAALTDTNSTQPSVHFVEYNSVSKIASFIGAPLFTPNARASMGGTRKFVGSPNAYQGSQILLQACRLASDSCDRIQTTNKAISHLTVNRKSTLLGVILDNKLIAYFIDASFGPMTPHMTVDDAINPSLVASEDIDGDGLADFIVFDVVARKISILRQANSGSTPSFVMDGNLSEQLRVALGDDAPTALFVNDIDGDGLEDVVYATAANEVAWLVNPGQDGSRKFVKGGTLSGLTGSVDSLAVGDVDADGKNDIVIASKSEMKIKIYINQATY